MTSTLARPTGGNIALFELVNALSRCPDQHVELVHMPFRDPGIQSLEELGWMKFDPAVSHRFGSTFDTRSLPEADVIVYTMNVVAAASELNEGAERAQLIRALDGRERGWLPILFLQGLSVFREEIEELVVRLPGPKVCVGRRLANVLLERGLPPADVVHIPNGVDPERFYVSRPIADRPARVAMNFDPHPVKGGNAGLDALIRLHDALGVSATVFGTRAPEKRVPAGMQFVLSPLRSTIADEIYNKSSLYLQPSILEGFGMSAVEAMACGCALVTTANGGCDDYARDGETALVCGRDPEQMAEALALLVRDDALRVRLASNGTRFVERFRWTSSAQLLVQLAQARLAGSRQ